MVMRAIVGFIFFLWFSISAVYCKPIADKPSPVLNKQQQDASLENKQAAQRLCSLFAGIVNIKANIVQKITGASKKDKIETGYFIFKQPNNFKWKIESPYSQEIFVNKQQTVTIDPDFKQVVINKTNKQILCFNLFSNDSEKLEKEYSISINSNKKQTIFYLTPKVSNDLFDSMILIFVSSKLSEINYQDILGNITKIELKQVVTNIKLKDDEFQPNIKNLSDKGYDIADYR